MSERPPVSGAVGLESPLACVAGPPLPVPPLSWEGLFPTLPINLQSALLARAVKQGGLATSDLPTVAGTSRLPISDRAFMQALLGNREDLPAFLSEELASPHRSPAEAHALAAALGCPDLLLIDFEPGPDRLGFATELAIESSRRGERVVILTATPGEADTVVVRLAERADLLVARALGPGEHPDRLPGASAIRTAREHGEGVVNSVRKRLAAARKSAETKQAAIRSAREKEPELRRLAARHEWLMTEESELPDRLASDPGSPFASILRARADTNAADCARLDAESQKLAANLADRRQELKILQTAKSDGRRGLFGTIIRGLFGGTGEAVSAAEREKRARSLEVEIRTCEADVARIAEERARVERDHRRACDQLIRDETERQQVILAPEQADVATAFRNLWTTLAGVGQSCPTKPTIDAVEQAQAFLDIESARIESELGFASEWAVELEQRAPELVREFLGLVRVVVGPVAAVGIDGLVPADEPRFNRLILTAADHLGEAVLPRLARAATRWVLLGDASSPGHGHRGPVAHRGRRDVRTQPRSGFFAQLWHRHHESPWVSEGDRLVARLIPVDPARSGSVTAEPLTDRPEVELRFARGRDGEPVVAEVAFPAELSLAEAKAFLASELGEIRLVTIGPVRWSESSECLLAEWPLVETSSRAQRTWVELAHGVREQVAGSGSDGLTAAIEFAKDCGWDRERAVTWLTRKAATPRAIAGPRSHAAISTRQPVGAAV